MLIARRNDEPLIFEISALLTLSIMFENGLSLDKKEAGSEREHSTNGCRFSYHAYILITRIAGTNSFISLTRSSLFWLKN